MGGTIPDNHGNNLKRKDKSTSLNKKGHGKIIQPKRTLPVITGFKPELGLPGSVIEVYGNFFSPRIQDNIVTVGDERALVVEASRDRLKVILGPHTQQGPVEVLACNMSARSANDFQFPMSIAHEIVRDGHPILVHGIFEHIHLPELLTQLWKLKVLLVFLAPSDLTKQATGYPLPDTFLPNIKQRAVARWTRDTYSYPQTEYDDRNTDHRNVHNYFDQASYHKLYVEVDMTRWYPLKYKREHYVVIDGMEEGTNIRKVALEQFWTEMVSAAKFDTGLDNKDISQYDVIAGIIYLEGNGSKQIRCWSAEPKSSFNYIDPVTKQNIEESLPRDVGLIAVDEQTDWRRCSHELAHYLIDTPAGLSVSGKPAGTDMDYVTVLQEDLYSFDLGGNQSSSGNPPPAWASAELFDLMGDDQEGAPLFSAYNMERLGFYKQGDIATIDWATENGGTYRVAAHGLKEALVEGCYHLIKIRIANGLYYYIEVRQSPYIGPGNVEQSKQVFDNKLRYYSGCCGGVVVTKVLTGVVNNNQMMRYITLMHDQRALGLGQKAEDPERNLRITVTAIPASNDPAYYPLVCEVKVERVPRGGEMGGSALDLWITPWNSSFKTPDIWVTRLTPDNSPVPMGDQTPMLGRVNKLYARVHSDSAAIPEKDVNVYFYSIYPPEVGDIGNWSWIYSVIKKKADIAADITNKGYFDTCVDWIPEVDVHTCIRVHIESENGENDYSNNVAQENYNNIDAGFFKLANPIVKPVTVRNPLNKETTIFLNVTGVPRGFVVQFPNAWLTLGPKDKRTVELIIVPTLDLRTFNKMDVKSADILISGYVPVFYKKELSSGNRPGSRMHRIGGITYRVTLKQGAEIKLAINKKKQKAGGILLDGQVSPALEGVCILVELVDADGRLQVANTDTDADGRFHASFKPFPVTKFPVKPQAIVKMQPDTYRAQAFIVDSPVVAASESNAVIIKAGFK